MAPLRWITLAALCALAACDGSTPSDSVGAADVAVARDAVTDATVDQPATDAPQGMDAAVDAPTVDAGADAVGTDAAGADAAGDAGVHTEILGTLSGACGTLAAMLHSPSPSLVENAVVFMAPERYERAALSPDGQRIFDTANAGGSSAESEVMSFEVLHFCEGASLVATETEIHYQPPDDSGANSITDILVRIGAERVGVSVTRAYRPTPMVFGDAEARALLTTKLTGINRSSMRVLPDHRWVKQILHVWAANMAQADAVSRVWPTLDASLRADTIVLVSVSRGGGFIYCNPDPPLGSECPSL